MLVLSRKPNQSVRIGEHITINVVRIKGNTIQLGIEAPQDVRILRAELEQRQTPAAEQATPAPQTKPDDEAAAGGQTEATTEPEPCLPQLPSIRLVNLPTPLLFG